MSRTITALFDSRADAEKAQDKLATAGIGAGNISIYDQSSLNGTATGNTGSGGYGATSGTARADSGGELGSIGDRTTSASGHGRGIWAEIKSWFSDDADTYEEGLRRGGYLLTATIDEADADRAIDILDDDGTVDTDERASAWRNDGWTGGARDREPDLTGSSDDLDREQSIPAEERLRVGKREANRGGVRVRSYIVEEPVDEEVTLRDERIDLERYPTGTATGSDGRPDSVRSETGRTDADVERGTGGATASYDIDNDRGRI